MTWPAFRRASSLRHEAADIDRGGQPQPGSTVEVTRSVVKVVLHWNAAAVWMIQAVTRAATEREVHAVVAVEPGRTDRPHAGRVSFHSLRRRVVVSPDTVPSFKSAG
jgi:hypothetical protein